MELTRSIVTRSKELRLFVVRRAGAACEYCHLPESASRLPHQVDHIIANQHGGPDDVHNLCLCCIRCNLKKGPNIASIDPMTSHLTPLFHPRQHSWPDHFVLLPDATLRGLTPEGRATVHLLEMNGPDRVKLRRLALRLRPA